MPAHLIAEEGPLQGLILDLDEGDEWIVGRSPETADFVIDDSTVSRKHARIYRSEEGIFLQNLSKVNATLVNDEEFREPVLLKEGDKVQIGDTTFLFSEEDIPKLEKPPKEEEEEYDDVLDELEIPEEQEILSSENPPEKEEKKEESAEETDKEEAVSYDTIFEDTPEDEELAFDLPKPPPFLLKVISGPNAGAEIGIEKGHTYTLGKDPELCDILFQDLSVSRTHARLSVSPEGVIEIEDLGSKNGTAVGGVPVTEKRVISSHDLVALGTTIFVIIDREAVQETIYSPLTSAQAPQEVPPEEEGKPPEEKEKRHWKKEPIPPKHLIMIGSIAAVFLIAFFSFFSLFKSSTVEIVHKEPASEIREALEGKKFEGVEFSFNPASGKLFLVGHVLTSVDYQEMRYKLSQIPFIMSVEDTVVIDDGVSKIMNDILGNNPDWKGISIRALESGKFTITGYLQTNAEMNQVSEYLVVNFPYPDRLENKIAVEENLNNQVGGLLLSSGFGAVSYQLNNGEVIFSGVFDHRKESQFINLLKEVRKIPSITSVKNFAIPTSPNLAAINITSQYRVSGISLFDGKGFNAILNGKIYSVGDLVNGMNIVNIEENTILLEKDGIKYRIEYAR